MIEEVLRHACPVLKRTVSVPLLDANYQVDDNYQVDGKYQVLSIKYQVLRIKCFTAWVSTEPDVPDTAPGDRARPPLSRFS